MLYFNLSQVQLKKFNIGRRSKVQLVELVRASYSVIEIYTIPSRSSSGVKIVSARKERQDDNRHCASTASLLVCAVAGYFRLQIHCAESGASISFSG